MTSAEDKRIDAEIDKYCNGVGIPTADASAEIEAILLKVGKRMVLLQYLSGLMMLLAIVLIVYIAYKTWILT